MATKASRNTEETGRPFEYYCQHLLESAGFNVIDQSTIGLRPTGGKHVVDLEIIDESKHRGPLISCKWQEVGGSAYEKIIFESVSLQKACDDYGYTDAYILMSGPGWRHEESFRDGSFDRWVNAPNVKVINFDEFVEIFNLTEV